MNRNLDIRALFDGTSSDFLAHIHLTFRGAFKDHGLRLVRSGLSDPGVIEERLREWLEARQSTLGDHALKQVDAHHEQFRAWLASLPDHDRHVQAMPPEVRVARKKTMAREHVARWMSVQPPSDKQVWRLRNRLGYRGCIPSSMADTARLIDDLQNGGKA